MNKPMTKEMEALPVVRRDDLKDLPVATPGLSYFAVGTNCWGKGPTAVQAVTNCRKNASPNDWYILHLVNTDTEVDGVNGSLYYNKATPGIRLSFARVKVN